VLSQYALWHLAEFARATGNLTLEREQLRRLITGSPSSSLRAAAVFRLGQSFFESQDYAAAIAALSPISAPKVSSTSRAAMLLLARAYLGAGNIPAAREMFDSLISQAPDSARPDDNSLAAARNLDELDGRKDRSGTRLPATEHLRRAGIYQFNRDFGAARRHYQILIADFPQSASVPDAQYQIGRGFFQEAKYEEAITWFQKLQQSPAAGASARDALAQMAGAQNRLQRTDAAGASYQQLISRYPDAPNPERPYLNVIDALREAGRDREALNWVQQTRQRFKGQTPATLALFSQARIHFSQGNWAAALDDVAALQEESDLGGPQTAGSTSQVELAFMNAYALEQLGRTSEAVDAYLAIPDGRNEYYGAQSTLRLRRLAKQPNQQGIINEKLETLRTKIRQASDMGGHEQIRSAAQAALRLTEDDAITRELLEIARRAYQNLPAYNPFPALRLVPLGRQEILSTNTLSAGAGETNVEPSHQRIADELIFLGLYDEGAAELAAANRERTIAATATAPQAATADLDYTLAVYFMRGGNANQAMRFAQPLWKNVPRDYLLALAPPDLAQLLYPAPYASALLAHGPQRGVDPRFLLAIARQESGFLPEAKSASAARGLMQFISATAAGIASQLGKRAFRDEELYDPGVSILFGAQYLSNLFKRFPDMPQAVAASYNGGDDNMARWIARAQSNEADRYVLEIGFAQSKDYVFRVMSNYRAYQILYSEQLQPRQSAIKLS
jgi:soluble lytic murein transglycosylase